MDELADVFKRYAIPGEHPESLLKAIRNTRDKIHDLKFYEKTEEYMKELDKELRKWMRVFVVLFKKEELNTHNFVQIFSKLFSLLRIDKITIFNSGDNFKAESTQKGYREFSQMSLGEQFFHIMKPREVTYPRGNGSTCRYWAIFLMIFFNYITEKTDGKSRIFGLKSSRHVSNAIKIKDNWFIIDVMENPCILHIDDPCVLKMIDPSLRLLRNRNELLDGAIQDERINVFETVEDFIAST